MKARFFVPHESEANHHVSAYITTVVHCINDVWGMEMFFLELNYGMKFVLENDIRHRLYYTNLPRNIMNYWLLRLVLLFEFWRLRV